MQVLNVHEREIAAPATEVGGLLNSLSSESDALWPKTMWPPMRFNGPLGVGAAGGHGPVRYTVEEYRAGQMVKFRFSGPSGFDSFHCFEVLPRDEARTVLRHTLDMKAHGPALLTWPLVFRPLHDALLEDSLALAQAHFGSSPRLRSWSPWVRFLRWAFSSGKARGQRPPPASQTSADIARDR